MRIILLCSLILLSLPSLYAQEADSFLNLEKDFLQEDYSLNGQPITERQALALMAIYPDVRKMLKTSRRNELFSQIIFGIGASGLIASVADGVSKDELSLGPTLFTGAVMAGGIVWWSASISKAKKSVKMYNQQHNLSKVQNKHVHLRVGLTNRGLALKLSF